MPINDRDRIEHMRIYAEKALHLGRGMTHAQLCGDERTALAMIKCLEIVGEAAFKMSPQTRADYPAVPWTSVIAMRHILVHNYHSLNYEIIWRTISEDLRPLLAALTPCEGP